MDYPVSRPRRLRRNASLRAMLRETQLQTSDLIMPIFVDETTDTAIEIPSMPGIYRLPLADVVAEAKKIYELGIPAIILFGIPKHKDDIASSAYADNGIVQEAIRAIKASVAGLQVIADVCNCEYTDHGHCGILTTDRYGVTDVDNDKTLELLMQSSASLANAGADMLAPSDMMDGRVEAIREALDENGFSNIPIMSYSVKYASAFYGPFRDAADSTPEKGDRKTYQMDPANVREAMREAMLDEGEGADILMVKPALSYLDVIRAVREETDLPVAAYNVSGEYAMVKAAANNGWIDEEKIVLEILQSIKRAGADIIITYHAKDAAAWLA